MKLPKLRLKRIAKGYTQDYMAEKLNISQPHYGRLERGECHMSAEQLVSICKLLKTAFEELTDGAIPCS